jgi:hypothetical protein
MRVESLWLLSLNRFAVLVSVRFQSHYYPQPLLVYHYYPQPLLV